MVVRVSKPIDLGEQTGGEESRGCTLFSNEPYIFGVGLLLLLLLLRSIFFFFTLHLLFGERVGPRQVGAFREPRLLCRKDRDKMVSVRLKPQLLDVLNHQRWVLFEEP